MVAVAEVVGERSFWELVRGRPSPGRSCSALRGRGAPSLKSFLCYALKSPLIII